MKTFVCALALVACVVACKSGTTTSVSDPSAPNASAPACSEKASCGTTCTEKAECSSQKASCCQKAKPQG